MARIHVVFIMQSLGVGGAERSVINVINHSDPERFRFSIIVFDDVRTMAPLIKRSDVVIRHVPRRGKISWHVITDLKLVLQELKADIVHTELYAADVYGAIAAKQLGLPVVCTEQNVNYKYGWARNVVKRMFANKPDEYIAISEAVKTYMLDTYAITKPITIIPHGIETYTFAEVKPIHDQSPWRLTVLGRLVEQKGHATLLRALSQLKEYHWKLSVVGEGPLLESLKKLTNELTLSGRVEFAPFTHEIAHVLEETDFLLVPSHWEGLGIVAREGMAAGRVVIASDTGGLSETIVSGVNGWLVPSGDVLMWRERVKYCFEHPDEDAQLAEAARMYARDHFGVEAMAVAYCQMYEKLFRAD